MYGFKEDPFLLKLTSSERHLTLIPFIPTDSYRVVSGRVFYHFEQPSSSEISLYLYCVGSIGVGKSTAMLHLKKELDKKDFRVAYLGTRYKSEAAIYRAVTGSYQAYAPTFNEKWDATRSIVIFDVPDEASGTYLSKMGFFMQELIVKFRTSIIVVFNYPQFQRFSSLGTILGKFSPYNLTPFTFDETMNMIHKRIARVREKPHNNPLYPFDEEILKGVHKITQGNPRNILNLCSLLLERREKFITVELLRDVTKEDYVMKIITQRFQDSRKIRILAQIIKIVETDFEGVVPSQGIFFDAIKSKLGFSKNTALKRVSELTKCGILIDHRNDEEPWRKEYRIITNFIE